MKLRSNGTLTSPYMGASCYTGINHKKYGSLKLWARLPRTCGALIVLI